MRIVHEASLYDDNCFVTLTYRPKYEATRKQLAKGQYLPDDGSLNKKHFQKFMKRLRKRYSEKIRYYHCGEYGDQLDRPHYHACLFNIRFDDLEQIGSREGVPLFTSKTLETIWGFGFVSIGELNFETAAYTARYCLKKVNGKKAHDHYLRADENGVAYWLQPEYTSMSTKPGIGKTWYEKFKTDVHPSNEVPVPGRGVFKKVPRYYEKILERTDPALMEQIKEERKTFIRQNPEEFTDQRLESKYQVKKAQLSQLKRGLEDEIR